MHVLDQKYSENTNIVINEGKKLLNIFVETDTFFRIILLIEISKEQNLFEREIIPSIC